MNVPFDRVKNLVADLSELEPPERQVRLDAECGDDAELRAEVESLLAYVDAPADALDRPAPRPTSSPATPRRIGPYRIIRLLASGGMGTVYLAEQDQPRRTVALKTMRHRLGSAELIRRFQRESELLGRLQHPGIAQIFEAGTFDDGDGPAPFFALEYVDGLRVTDYARCRELDTRARLRLVIEICDAVKHAHQRGVVHRDLKPDNVLVDSSGQPKILDFGIARSIGSDTRFTTLHTEPGQLIGTLSYMSPEQVSGNPDSVDTRSDVYALGVLLFELLADRLPLQLQGYSIPDAARIIREDTPTRLGSVHTALRGDLETIVGRALEKDVDRRYSSAHALADDLNRFLTNVPITARPPSAFYQLRKFAKRNKAFVTSVLATLVVAVIGAVVATLFALESARNEAQAVRALAFARITLADASAENAPRRARRALDEVPEKLRNWEWNYLDTLLRPACRHRSTDRGSVAFSSSTALFASCNARTIRIHEIDSGASRAVIEAPTELAEVRLCANGTRVAATSMDHTRVFVWNLSVQQPRFDSAGHDRVRHLSLSAAGDRIAITSARATRVYDVRTARTVFTSPRALRCAGAELSAAGDHVAIHTKSRGASYAEVFDIASGKRVSSYRASYVASAFAPGNGKLAVGTRSQDLWLFEVGKSERPARWKITEKCQALAFSPDGSRLATASKRELRVWDLATRRSLRAYGVGAREVRWSSDGRTLAAATRDGGILLDLERRRSCVLRDGTSRNRCVAFAPNGSLVAAMNDAGSLTIWNLTRSEPAAKFALRMHDRRGRFRGRCLQFSRDGSRLMASGPNLAGRWVVWEVDRTGDWQRAADGNGVAEYWLGSPPLARRGNAAAIGKRVYLPAHNKPRIRVFDRISGDECASSFDFGSAKPASAIALSSDGELLATGHKGGVLRLWNRTTGEELRSVPAHDDVVYSIDFHPDGSRLVTGGLDFEVRVWNVTTLEEVLELRGHTNSVRGVAFSPDGTRIASCSSDGTVRVWDGARPRPR